MRLYVAAAVAALLIGAAITLYLWGWRGADNANRLDELQRKADTNERIDNADVGEGDPDLDREWLLNRGGR